MYTCACQARRRLLRQQSGQNRSQSNNKSDMLTDCRIRSSAASHSMLQLVSSTLTTSTTRATSLTCPVQCWSSPLVVTFTPAECDPHCVNMLIFRGLNEAMQNQDPSHTTWVRHCETHKLFRVNVTLCHIVTKFLTRDEARLS